MTGTGRVPNPYIFVGSGICRAFLYKYAALMSGVRPPVLAEYTLGTILAPCRNRIDRVVSEMPHRHDERRTLVITFERRILRTMTVIPGVTFAAQKLLLQYCDEILGSFCSETARFPCTIKVEVKVKSSCRKEQQNLNSRSLSLPIRNHQNLRCALALALPPDRDY